MLASLVADEQFVQSRLQGSPEVLSCITALLCGSPSASGVASFPPASVEDSAYVQMHAMKVLAGLLVLPGGGRAVDISDRATAAEVVGRVLPWLLSEVEQSGERASSNPAASTPHTAGLLQCSLDLSHNDLSHRCTPHCNAADALRPSLPPLGCPLMPGSAVHQSMPLFFPPPGLSSQPSIFPSLPAPVSLLPKCSTRPSLTPC